MTVKRKKQTHTKKTDVYPQIRPGLEVVDLKDRSKNLFGLRDRWEISQHIVALSAEVFYLLQFFDGRHSLQDIRYEYLKRFDAVLPEHELNGVIELLNENFFLHSERFIKKIREIKKYYQELPIRPSRFAGLSYAKTAGELEKQLNDYCSIVHLSRPLVNKVLSRHIHGLVVPHIDISLAGSAYASAWKYVQHSQPADLYVILGIAHRGIENGYALTTKDYDTPLGILRTDQKMVDAVAGNAQFDFLSEEYMHQNEHSIEFQTLYLAHMIKKPFAILPVLCSFDYEIFDAPLSTERNKALDFIASLRQALAQYSGKVTFVASVDLVISDQIMATGFVRAQKRTRSSNNMTAL